MSYFKKFKELAWKGNFYSYLTGKKIIGKEYDHVLKVWNKFEMKTMQDYHDLDLNCDVLLLAVFLKCRNNCLKNYGLCLIHDLSTPALNWGAMFNMTKVHLELIPDPEMFIFFEKSMRDGVSNM